MKHNVASEEDNILLTILFQCYWTNFLKPFITVLDITKVFDKVSASLTSLTEHWLVLQQRRLQQLFQAGLLGVTHVRGGIDLLFTSLYRMNLVRGIESQPK